MVGSQVKFRLVKFRLVRFRLVEFKKFKLRQVYGLGGLLLGLTLALTSCSPLVTVQNVRQQPQRNWFTKTVKLQGQVGSLAPLINGQVYELQDATGKIWVLSPSRQSKSGQRILIQGRVRYQPIEIAGQNLGEVYIEEQQQLEPTP